MFTRQALLREMARRAPPGFALEFGVFKAQSLLAIRGARKPWVYGFDCWTGLPEAWELGTERPMKRGTFATERPREADLPWGVRLVDGLFEESLPRWFAEHNIVARFVHIDCDLYSSTATVLRHLTDRVAPGTIIVFDELIDWEHKHYPAWPAGEFRAMLEWVGTTGIRLRAIGRSAHQQVAYEVCA